MPRVRQFLGVLPFQAGLNHNISGVRHANQVETFRLRGCPESGEHLILQYHRS
jgi:hypothetical protein